ncbi:molecular chaperone [Providencia vermicola]|uniref:fimbrial biogenesis chaperone n=1 Tax=Providencia vermicola TaxID=333965 RepID=UPI003524823E
MFILRIFLFSLLIGINGGPQAAEGLRLPQTRVIFNANDKSTTAGIQNLSSIAYLVKTQILDATKEKPIALFVVTPPLFRLEPQSEFTVRILSQEMKGLPTDRESLFYLSFLAIPSTNHPKQNADEGDEAEVTARVSVGVQTLIKMFYRPTKLPMTAREAQSKLVFNTHNDRVVMDNPTPYYLTLNTLIINEKHIDLSISGAMIDPFSQKTYQIQGNKNQVTYTVINDYGAVSQPYQRTLSVLEKTP